MTRYENEKILHWQVIFIHIVTSRPTWRKSGHFASKSQIPDRKAGETLREQFLSAGQERNPLGVLFFILVSGFLTFQWVRGSQQTALPVMIFSYTSRFSTLDVLMHSWAKTGLLRSSLLWMKGCNMGSTPENLVAQVFHVVYIAVLLECLQGQSYFLCLVFQAYLYQTYCLQRSWFFIIIIFFFYIFFFLCSLLLSSFNRNQTRTSPLKMQRNQLMTWIVSC